MLLDIQEQSIASDPKSASHALTWLSDNTRVSHTLSAILQRLITKDIGESWHLWSV